MCCFQGEQEEGILGNARLRDRLTGALVGLARGTEGNEDMISPATDKAMLEGLFATGADAGFRDEAIAALIAQVQEEKRKLVPNCFFCAAPCGRTSDYDMGELLTASEDIRSVKSSILSGIRDMAAYAYRALALGYTDKDINRFFYKALYVLGTDWGKNELLAALSEMDEIRAKCTALPG